MPRSIGLKQKTPLSFWSAKNKADLESLSPEMIFESIRFI